MTSDAPQQTTARPNSAKTMYGSRTDLVEDLQRLLRTTLRRPRVQFAGVGPGLSPALDGATWSRFQDFPSEYSGDTFWDSYQIRLEAALAAGGSDAFAEATAGMADRTLLEILFHVQRRAARCWQADLALAAAWSVPVVLNRLAPIEHAVSDEPPLGYQLRLSHPCAVCRADRSEIPVVLLDALGALIFVPGKEPGQAPSHPASPPSGAPPGKRGGPFRRAMASLRPGDAVGSDLAGG